MTRWIPQPSSTLICFLSSLCTGLLFVIIILVVTITRQGVDQTEHSMEVKLRNLSLWVNSRVDGLSQHDSLIMEKLKVMETFVKDLRRSEVMSKVVEIETSMELILSEKVTGSMSNDHQKILVALGELAEEIWKGNDSADPLCDVGWVHHGSSCYFLHRRIQPWSTAETNCEEKKAHLVVINSDDEMKFLRQFSRSLAVWIGLKDQHGDWQWVDGTPFEKTSKFWWEDQSDNWFGEGLEEEKCARIVDEDGWSVSYCFLSLSYICEKTKS